MSEQPFQMKQPLGLFAGDLLIRSQEYFDAFERLHLSEGREIRFPMYFLLAHATELLLKAHLAAQGVEKKTMRNIGHGLKDLFAACDDPLLKNINHLDQMVDRLQIMNQHNDFRYPSGYVLSVPEPRECLVVIKEWLAYSSPIIKRAAIVAELEFGSQTNYLKPRKIQWSD